MQLTADQLSQLYGYLLGSPIPADRACRKLFGITPTPQVHRYLAENLHLCEGCACWREKDPDDGVACSCCAGG